MKVGQVKRTWDRNIIKRSWHFHGHQQSDRYGVLNMAKWIWEANSDNSEIEDVSRLYSGLVIHIS
jgi:hypothetical protein